MNIIKTCWAAGLASLVCLSSSMQVSAADEESRKFYHVQPVAGISPEYEYMPADVSASCAEGWAISGHSCQQDFEVSLLPNETTISTCDEDGFSLVEEHCQKTNDILSQPRIEESYSCDSDRSLNSDGQCIKNDAPIVDVQPYCNNGGILTDNDQKCEYVSSPSVQYENVVCPEGTDWVEEQRLCYGSTYEEKPPRRSGGQISCTNNPGYTLHYGDDGWVCRKLVEGLYLATSVDKVHTCQTGDLVGEECLTITTAEVNNVYSCQENFQLSGDTCINSIQPYIDTIFVCDPPTALDNDICRGVEIINSPPRIVSEYECQDGLSLINGKCEGTITEVIDANLSYSCPDGWISANDQCKRRVRR